MDAYPQEVWFQFLVNLSRYIDSRISLSRKHSAQVALWARDTARLMDRPEHEVQTIFWAAMLHENRCSRRYSGKVRSAGR